MIESKELYSPPAKATTIDYNYNVIRREMRVLSFDNKRLLAELPAARADSSRHKLLTKLTVVELLITENLGLQPISAQGVEVSTN